MGTFEATKSGLIIIFKAMEGLLWIIKEEIKIFHDHVWRPYKEIK